MGLMRRKANTEAGMPLLGHLKALRKVLLISLYAAAAGAIAGWVFSDYVFAYLTMPVARVARDIFITTTPMEPVMVKLKVSLVVGIFIASPIIFWQIWGFVLPALKKTERRWLYLIVPCSLLLFFGGAAFCFYIVLPIGVKFLLFAGGNAVPTTTLLTKTSYLSFILTFLFTVGLFFQIPIVLSVLVNLGVVQPKTLAKKRRWAFFLIVVVAAVFSPTPELMSQGLMVLPMYLLYEISIWLGYLIARRRRKRLNSS
jgi:sec-independent protein translocase protein TatC